MSQEGEEPGTDFVSMVEGMFTSDQVQLMNLHQFFSDAVVAGFTEDQALSLTAKLLTEVGLANREEE